MLHNRPIRLKVSNRGDLALPVYSLNLLLVPAALLSPHPILLTLAVILFIGAGWIARTLKNAKTNSEELTSVIFPDGQVRLESTREVRIAGFLGGQQWCTRWFAVLRVSHGSAFRNVIVLRSQQLEADDFRRLNMWLRQDLFKSAGVKQVLDS
jgi:hypothetical protein